MADSNAARLSKSDPLTFASEVAWDEFIPKKIGAISDHQRQLPAIAKDPALIAEIEQQLQRVPSRHNLFLGDARRMDFLSAQSVQLVLTSPPYWTLKDYNRSAGQMGYIEDYRAFVTQLDLVWRRCFEALVPGGRLICVVGDVCLSRRKNNGRHMVVPLHASIQEHCREIGFDNLAPIIWHKIANASYEVENGGGGFLGKPYEPNAVIKNDIEFILMQRKPGGYRNPSVAVRLLSLIPESKQRAWFQQIWSGLTGASTRDHPAPYPLELAERLIRMFSFAGDVVLDPFLGSGTTSLAAARLGRNSVGVEVDPQYFEYAAERISRETRGLFSSVLIETHL